MDLTVLTDYSDYYLAGFLTTIEASLLGLIGSFVLGIVIAVFRIAPFKPLNALGTAYVEFIRNIPLLITVFIFYAGLPSIGIDMSGFVAGTLGLCVYTSAFIAEAIRAGIQAVPAGQMEAARSSGLTYIQAMRFIILPQAIRIVIPPLGNQFLNLVKNSSILAIVAGGDLMYQGDLVYSSTFDTVSTYAFVAAFYLLLTIPLSQLVNYLERRMAKAY
ncbi:MAG TPA: amino acid ABC transporter permease [Bacilli bacterium]|nr:amino acid ABC transporter permease [Bacilli bacterium]